jgi:uncharacterized membrane protein SpoIIM required for sporulation
MCQRENRKMRVGHKLRLNLLRAVTIVRGSRRHISIVFFLLLGSALLAYRRPETVSPLLLAGVEESFQSWAMTYGGSYPTLVIFIFLKNVTSILLALVLGTFLGIAPILSCLTNGLIIGLVAQNVVSQYHSFSPLLLLLPHGIFELPAVIVGLGMGLKLGFSWFAQNERLVSFRQGLEEARIVFVYLVCPLLFLAALIESASFFGMR